MAEGIGVPTSAIPTLYAAMSIALMGCCLTEEFKVMDIRWSPDGRGMVLMDAEVFCCAFLVANEDADADTDEQEAGIREAPAAEELVGL